MMSHCIRIEMSFFGNQRSRKITFYKKRDAGGELPLKFSGTSFEYYDVMIPRPTFRLFLEIIALLNCVLDP